MTSWITWDSNSSAISATTDLTWHNVTIPPSDSTFQTYKITYYDPMEDQYKIEEPEKPKPKKKVKKTTVDPLDWLNQRVEEITELVEL